MSENDKKEKETNSSEPYQEFKDLFPEKVQEEKEKEEINSLRRKMLWRHILSLVVYGLGMTLLILILQIVIILIPNSTITYNQEEEVVRRISEDINGLTFMTPETFDKYRDKYLETLIDFKFNDEYLVIVSRESYDLLYYEEPDSDQESELDLSSFFRKPKKPKLEWFIKDELGNVVIDKVLFNSYLDGDIKQWSNFRKIKLYVTTPEFGVRPDFINYEKLKVVEIENKGIVFTTGAGNVLNFLVYGILIIPLGFLLFPNIKEDWMKFKQNRSLLIGMFAGLGFVYGSSLILGLLFEILDVPQITSANQASIESSLMGPGWPLMMLSAVIIGPIVEELIFRKTIFEITRNKWVGLAVSSIIFATIHVVTELGDLTNFGHFIITFLPYLAMGVAFGVTYIIYKQNVITVIGAHMMWNLLATLSVFLRPYLGM